MMDFMSTYIVLHNLCIITNDKFDVIWIEEAEVELNEQTEDDTVKKWQFYEKKNFYWKKKLKFWDWRSGSWRIFVWIRQDQKDVE